MKFPVPVCALLLLPLFALGPIGCGKPDEPPPEVKAEETPSPTSGEDAVAAASDKFKNKTDKTIKSLSGFLHNDDPRFQAKLQKLADKISHDKDKWRKRLQEKRAQLEPQIEALKDQVAKAEDKSRDEVNRQLETLKAQSQNMGQKLSELESATGDRAKKIEEEIKAEYKEAKAKADVTRDKAAVTPTPSP